MKAHAVCKPRHHDRQSRETESRPACLDLVIEDVQFKGNHLAFSLSDRRTVNIHLLFFPGLLDASDSQRKNWKLIAGGESVIWSDLGEDISVTALLALQDGRYLADRSNGWGA
jgi:hypothetical protein